MTTTTTRHTFPQPATWPVVRPAPPYRWSWQPAGDRMWRITVTVTDTGQQLATTVCTRQQPGRATSERIALRLFGYRREEGR